MKKLIIFVLVSVISVAASAVNNIAATIEQKIKQTDPNLNIGIKITNLDQNKIVFEKNTDRYFIPASTLKFITIVSLLEYFGSDYKFTSSVLNDGKDYYLDIYDPDFNNSDLDSMVVSIAKHSNEKIQGNIYIVDNEFTLPAMMRSKTYSDTIYCYGAPITKVHINKNCSKLKVDTTKVGQKIKIKMARNFPYVIENNAITISKNSLDRLHNSIEDGKYIINGTLSTSTGQVVIGAVANDNFAQVRHHLQKCLEVQGIELQGKILYGKLPFRAKNIASVSKSMKEVAAIAVKRTDNFMTDYLLSEFATQTKQIEWRRATENLKRFVFKKFAVDMTRSALQDGSGISRLNLLTINQFDSFLKAVALKPNFAEVKSIMACPGEECTLRERFKNMPKFYAKTGKLSGVSSLVGYFYDKNNELHSFVIIANNFYGGITRYHKLEEEIIRLVAE